MEKVTVWGSPENGGDGSVYMCWFLTQESATNHQDNMDDGWGEDCSFPVETYVGSNIHKKAV